MDLSYHWRIFFISTHALTEGDPGALQRLRGEGISTHALTEGDNQSGDYACDHAISTHALTEGDFYASIIQRHSRISTHALTEGDNAKEKRGVELRRFQLTPSRRATPLPGLIYTRTNFNSRPHGGRQSTTTRTPY